MPDIPLPKTPEGAIMADNQPGIGECRFMEDAREGRDVHCDTPPSRTRMPIDLNSGFIRPLSYKC